MPKVKPTIIPKPSSSRSKAAPNLCLNFPIAQRKPRQRMQLEQILEKLKMEFENVAWILDLTEEERKQHRELRARNIIVTRTTLSEIKINELPEDSKHEDFISLCHSILDFTARYPGVKEYKDGKKFIDMVTKLMSPLMSDLNKCCGIHPRLRAPVQTCDQKSCEDSIIDGEWCLKLKRKGTNDEYVFCIECSQKQKIFQTRDGKKIASPAIKEMTSYKSLKEEDSFICRTCQKFTHRICANNIENGGDCLHCKTARSTKRTKRTAWKLKRSVFSKFLEKSVKKELIKYKKMRYVFYRPLPPQWLKNEISDKARICTFVDQDFDDEHVEKTVYAFMKRGRQVSCFFGVQISEYYDKQKNPKVFSIDYVDRVTVAPPMKLLAQETVYACLDYARRRGFPTCQLFSCPPENRDHNYIFSMRPLFQPIMNKERLNNFYVARWKEAEQRKLIRGFTVSDYDTVIREDVKLRDIPYCPGNIWPIMLDKYFGDTEHGNVNAGSVQENDIKSWIRQQENYFGKSRTFHLELRKWKGVLLEQDKVLRGSSIISCGSFLDKAEENGWEFSDERRASNATKCLVSEIWKNEEERTTSSSAI